MASFKLKKNKLPNPGPGAFTKNNLRKTRKSRAKRLKVDFIPLYNSIEPRYVGGENHKLANTRNKYSPFYKEKEEKVV